MKNEQYRDELNTRWKQLHDLEGDYATAGLKFVFLSNSGGAVATLSFIGAGHTSADSNLVAWTLISFVAGIVAYGISVGFLYFRVAGIYSGYRKDANLALEGHISIQDLRSRDEKRTDKGETLDVVLPIISGLLFLNGCLLGGMALLGD